LDDFEYSPEEGAFDDLDHGIRPYPLVLDQGLGGPRFRRRGQTDLQDGAGALFVDENATAGQTEQDTLVILRGGRIRRIMEGFKGNTNDSFTRIHS
jgi:hypothetical protein